MQNVHNYIYDLAHKAGNVNVMCMWIVLTIVLNQDFFYYTLVL